jgi:hypothetical protein
MNETDLVNALILVNNQSTPKIEMAATTGTNIILATVTVAVLIFFITVLILWIKKKNTHKEVIKVQELRKNTIEVVNRINQNWVDELKSADKEGRGIDLTEMFGKFSDQMTKLEQHFRDAETRIKNPKKGRFF